MKGKASEVHVDMKLEYLGQVENLEKKRDAFMRNHGQLKTTSEHGWQDVKVGTEEARNELEESFDKVVARFK